MQNNIQGYSELLKLEISLREYLISKFSNSDLDLFDDVLNANQLKTLGIVKESYLSNIDKISLRRKAEKKNYNASKLWHPFYYLDFTDLESIFLNSKLSGFFDSLGVFKKHRLLIAHEITYIKPIRNDIAHAKLITENELDVIKLSYDKISKIIPELKAEITKQTSESILENLYKDFQKDFLNFLSDIDKNKYEKLAFSLDKLLNSFWIRYVYNELFLKLKELKKELMNINKRFGRPKFIMKKIDWRNKNKELLDFIESYEFI